MSSMKYKHHILLLWLMLCFPGNTTSSWLWFGVAPDNLVGKISCANISVIPARQLEICKRRPELLGSISRGSRTAIRECQDQFRNERWNCSTTGHTTVFGKELTRASRETAFIHAISSAGLTFSVTRGCSAGELRGCSCDPSLSRSSSDEGWQWGGCSDNVHYGITFCRKFVDAAENGRSVSSLMNLHNNEAGRQAVLKLLEINCRCHGVSGSCAMKTCWKTMSSFQKVGFLLKGKHERSILVAKRAGKLQKVEDSSSIHRDDLIHVERSPDFCTTDAKQDVLGTNGRECNKSMEGVGSCGSLCCGRGYNTFVMRTARRCECRFIWCCFVKCRLCETLRDVHTCK